MIELQEDKLGQVIDEKAKVVVQFGAAWCGSCRIAKPKFKNLAGTREDVTFVYVDAEKLPLSRKLAKVSHLPTFAAFKDGILVNQAHGSNIQLVEELVDEITRN